MNHATLCPCGSLLSYANCCARYITGKEMAPTAESLMRSRYTAYTQANLDYILRTMKSPAADGFDVTEVMAWLKEISWTKLEIVQSVENKDSTTVEFCAYYVYKNKVMCLHEISDFIRCKNAWYYIDGKTVMSNPEQSTVVAHKIGRNELCPCGSNKKYKKCCGNVS